MRATLLTLLLLFPASAAPPEVVVVRPVEREVFDHADVAGRTVASTTVEIRPRLAGQVVNVHFIEGAPVRKGDVLFQLDDRLARAEVERTQAEMRRAEARLTVAELDYKRLVKIGEAKSVSQEEVARAAATMEEAKAAIQAARAVVEAARISLDFTRIVSPIDGRIGLAAVAAGSMVKAGDELATVYALDPTYVYFDLTEQILLRRTRYTRERKGEVLPVHLALTADKGFPRRALIDFLAPSIDPKSGTLRVRAVLPNPEADVRPGQAVRVRVPLGKPRKALVVPEATIGRDPKAGYFVLVVNDQNRLADRPVRLGRSDGGLVVIDDGLRPDDRVVRNPDLSRVGTEVKPAPAKEPAAEPGGSGRGDQ